MSDLRKNTSGLLRALGMRLNTDLGQHFLVDENVLQAIVETAHIGSHDHIVEIGPGAGTLTRELLKRAGKVTAIEIDERFIGVVKACGVAEESRATLEVVHGNALETPMPSEPYRVVANIPYHITSPLLRHVYQQSAVAPLSMTLLIQREVAEKICDTKDAGLLTILVGLFGTPHYIATVPPRAFLPPPKVDSAILHIESHATPLAPSAVIDRVFVLAKHAFSGKRKMIRNTLGSLPDGADLLARSGIAGDRRPQTLSLDEWLRLATT